MIAAKPFLRAQTDMQNEELTWQRREAGHWVRDGPIGNVVKCAAAGCAG